MVIGFKISSSEHYTNLILFFSLTTFSWLFGSLSLLITIMVSVSYAWTTWSGEFVSSLTNGFSIVLLLMVSRSLNCFLLYVTSQIGIRSLPGLWYFLLMKVHVPAPQLFGKGWGNSWRVIQFLRISENRHSVHLNPETTSVQCFRHFGMLIKKTSHWSARHLTPFLPEGTDIPV